MQIECVDKAGHALWSRRSIDLDLVDRSSVPSSTFAEQPVRFAREFQDCFVVVYEGSRNSTTPTVFDRKNTTLCVYNLDGDLLWLRRDPRATLNLLRDGDMLELWFAHPDDLSTSVIATAQAPREVWRFNADPSSVSISQVVMQKRAAAVITDADCVTVDGLYVSAKRVRENYFEGSSRSVGNSFLKEAIRLTCTKRNQWQLQTMLIGDATFFGAESTRLVDDEGQFFLVTADYQVTYQRRYQGNATSVAGLVSYFASLPWGFTLRADTPLLSQNIVRFEMDIYGGSLTLPTVVASETSITLHKMQVTASGVIATWSEAVPLASGPSTTLTAVSNAGANVLTQNDLIYFAPTSVQHMSEDGRYYWEGTQEHAEECRKQRFDDWGLARPNPPVAAPTYGVQAPISTNYFFQMQVNRHLRDDAEALRAEFAAARRDYLVGILNGLVGERVIINEAPGGIGAPTMSEPLTQAQIDASIARQDSRAQQFAQPIFPNDLYVGTVSDKAVARWFGSLLPVRDDYLAWSAENLVVQRAASSNSARSQVTFDTDGNVLEIEDPCEAHTRIAPGTANEVLVRDQLAVQTATRSSPFWSEYGFCYDRGTQSRPLNMTCHEPTGRSLVVSGS